MKCFVLEYLTDEEAEEFGLWAFGNDFKHICTLELMKRWNSLHGSKYLLSGDILISASIPYMIELWKINLNNSQK